MKCLNCKSDLNENQNFCPHCGQKVDENNLKLGTLLKEFFENYLSFDTRIGRSIMPFFFKPGKLTKEFNEGKRKNYANPFRLYIFCSLLFFSAFSLNIGNGDVKDVININSPDMNQKIDLSKSQLDSLSQYLNPELVNKFKEKDSLTYKEVFDELELELEHQQQVMDILKDTSGINLLNDSLKTLDKENNIDSKENNSMLGKIDWLYLQKTRYDQSISDSAVYKHMAIEENDFLAAKTYFQIIKIYRSNQKEFAKFLFKNLSFAMFFIVPISAFLLMLLFGWKRFYVEYLIYSIHVHSLLFFISGIIGFIIYFLDLSVAFRINLFFLVLAYGAVYYLIGLYKLYAKSVFQTLLRAVVLFIFYGFCFVIISLIEFYISFLLF